jgi:predicted dehydrogenase
MALRLAVLGVGGLGYLQLEIYDQMPEITVVGAADVSADARDLFESEFEAPAYEGHEQLLAEHADDLDAVAIVTPHTLHYEQARAALERGLGVLVEKPMVTDVAHAVHLCELAERNDAVLQVGYQRHAHPAFREIRRVIATGRIGDLHMVNCHLGQDWVRPHRNTWRTDPELSGGGQLYDTGSHLLDALLWTTDGDPASVLATMEYDAPGVDVNTAMSVELRRDDESVLASVGLTGNGVSVEPYEGYFFWGTEGRLAFVDGTISVAERDAVTYSTEVTRDTDFHSLTSRMIRNFVAAVEGSEASAVPGEHGLAVTALTEATYRAADDVAAVDVQGLIDEHRDRVPPD